MIFLSLYKYYIVSIFPNIIIFENLVGIRFSREIKREPNVVKGQSFNGEIGVKSPGYKPEKWYINVIRWRYLIPHLSLGPKRSKRIQWIIFGSSLMTGVARRLSLLTANCFRIFTPDFGLGLFHNCVCRDLMPHFSIIEKRSKGIQWIIFWEGLARKELPEVCHFKQPTDYEVPPQIFCLDFHRCVWIRQRRYNSRFSSLIENI